MPIFLLLALMLFPTVQASQRVALVIGNGSYSDAALRNPANDARDMAETLKSLGFKVQRHIDLNEKQMHRAIRSFGRALAQAEVGVFYYAGHGMQVNNRNYLIPIGADIETEDEVPYEAVDAGQVLAKMESARNPVNILILDACRNNPLERSFRSSSRGLVRMPSPVGSLVLYATAPGKTAADGRGDRNGVFTKHLMNELRRPGVSLTDVVFNARVAVMKETGNEQVPWSSSSLTRRVILNQIGPLDKSMLPSVSESLKLIIEPAPSDARIRILNIGPKYKSGMTLSAGRYHIEVSRPGYKTERRWVGLSRERQVFSFALQEKRKASKPASVVKQKEFARGDEWRDPVTDMEFAWVPEGCFLMGCNENSAPFKAGQK
ncbi:MAG: hypothetical protein GY807_20410 [Gammaproteobacteria bacterium]|nr:hypothetical protein [Gammaproteobacteria bacterium]